MTRRTALELAAGLDRTFYRGCEEADMLRTQHAEIERLQRIIDTRPPINLALIPNYITWTNGIYECEIARARGHDS